MSTLFLNVGLNSIGLLLFASIAVAEESRIYQTDSTGNIQYHKPSAVVQENGRIIETDPYGNIQYHKPHGVVKK